MGKIVSIGETLVEVMADSSGCGFLEPMSFTGPFPSGAPPIYISQAARMGAATAYISTVGDDDFGKVNLDRLRSDGVDISAIAIDPILPTGHAFVRYRPDGNRDFCYNITYSASGQTKMTPEAANVIAASTHLHVVGNSMFTDEIREMTAQAAAQIKARGGTVSFDPNLRKEMLAQPGLREAIEKVLSFTDLFLPSGDELFLGVETTDVNEAIAQHLASGMKAVVHKRGAEGATYYDGTLVLNQPPFPAQEVDPTGAGDCFGGAFTALWTSGESAAECLRLAAAAGALAVMKRGPMSGAENAETVRAFADKHTRRVQGAKHV
ncbi:sugar kinase [Tropicimonas sp. TH_r6]|uniref:sugar kinase n=1 Tax=Tropicimonas sp. TH_r6 TaxID=3082085 RepID=UPI0029534EB7|nr:sugar kinase [Tropicimonas sp. TH_r6]MDV7145401.1 sugar kinase [Tropicimonas sp. TH_r6]